MLRLTMMGAAVALMLGSLAQADVADDCVQMQDNGLTIRACTEIIQAGTWSDRDTATAYSNRGIAKRRTGDLRGAIADYDQAIRLNPTFAKAWQNRGVAHEALGNYDAAISDSLRAIEIDGEPRVKWWQNYLKEHGHYAGPVDGRLGPQTRDGVAACIRDPDC